MSARYQIDKKLKHKIHICAINLSDSSFIAVGQRHEKAFCYARRTNNENVADARAQRGHSFFFLLHFTKENMQHNYECDPDSAVLHKMLHYRLNKHLMFCAYRQETDTA